MAMIVRRGKRFESQDNNKPLDGLTIGVLYGGPSAERDVSLQSGEAVATALIDQGHTVHRVILDDSFDVKMARSLDIDIAFLALHGEFGEDGRVQAILEEAGIPYTGSDPDASSIAFDKVLTKRHYEAHGVLTPAWMSIDRDEIESLGKRALRDLAPPVVIKPASSGSSLGVSIVKHPDEIPNAILEALNYGDTLIIERFVDGRELTVAVLDDEPLPVAELRLGRDFYDYQAKYEDDLTQIICPAELPRELATKAQAAALNAHRGLGCRDVSRTDMILDQHGLFWILETNTLPGLTSHSLLPKAADSVGIGFASMCEQLLIRALERKAAMSPDADGKDLRAA